MSSKILAGDQAGPAESHQWRRVGSPGPWRLSGDAGEMEAHLQQARQQGYREGEAAVSQKAAQQVEQALARAADSVKELLAVRRQMRLQAEQDLVHLAIVVARRILHRELSVDPEALLGVVKAALDKVETRDLYRIRVCPSDTGWLESRIGPLGLPARVELLADPELERGAVILETGRGLLDASVDTQLEEIERGFTDLVRRSQ